MAMTGREKIVYRLSRKKWRAFLRLLKPSNVVPLNLVRLMRRKAPWENQ